MAHQGEARDYYNESSNQQAQQYPNYPPQSYQNNGNNGYYQGQQQQQPQYQQQQGQQQYQQHQGNYPPPEGYQQKPPNYGQQYNNHTGDIAGKQDFAQAFKIEKPKYNDLWAGILFIVFCIGFVAVSAISLQKYSSSSTTGGIYGNNNDFSLNNNTIILFVFVLAVAIVVSWAYFFSARAFTKFFVWLTGILNCVMAIGTAIYYLYEKQYGAGIVFAIFAVFAVFCFISWIPRIPFTVLMLQTAMDVATQYGHVFLVSLIGGIVGIAFAAWFAVTMVAVYVAYEPNGSGTNSSCSGSGSCSSAKVIGLLAFITFCGYWITEFIKNAIHTTISGVYGSWYFCSGSPQGLPAKATRGAFKRTMTTSFGSVSFGSLIVAIINMLRMICSIARSQAAGNGDFLASIFYCILGCLIGLLDWVVQFINRYAFCHIALYGKAYIPAAKDTWKMLKDRGWDILIADCLIGPVLSFGSLFIAYLYLIYTAPAYNSSGSFTPVVMAYSFLIGMQICNIVMTPIASGVDALFVAMAWDPQVLSEHHPELFARLVAVYPRVQQAVQQGRHH